MWLLGISKCHGTTGFGAGAVYRLGSRFPAALSTVSFVLVRGKASGAFCVKVAWFRFRACRADNCVHLVAGGTLVGSYHYSLLLGWGALLGVRLWNEWWAPILEARNCRSRET